MTDVQYILGMLSKSTADYKVETSPADKGRRITVPSSDIELQFDKDGNFKYIYNRRSITATTEFK